MLTVTKPALTSAKQYSVPNSPAFTYHPVTFPAFHRLLPLMKVPYQYKENAGSNGFCAYCRATTTNEYLENAFTHYFPMGKILRGEHERCPDCGSVVKTAWFRLFVPIVPLGKFRVVCRHTKTGSTEYIARKIIDCEDKALTPYDTAGIERYY